MAPIPLHPAPHSELGVELQAQANSGGLVGRDRGWVCAHHRE